MSSSPWARPGGPGAVHGLVADAVREGEAADRGREPPQDAPPLRVEDLDEVQELRRGDVHPPGSVIAPAVRDPRLVEDASDVRLGVGLAAALELHELAGEDLDDVGQPTLGVDPVMDRPLVVARVVPEAGHHRVVVFRRANVLDALASGQLAHDSVPVLAAPGLAADSEVAARLACGDAVLADLGWRGRAHKNLRAASSSFLDIGIPCPRIATVCAIARSSLIVFSRSSNCIQAMSS